MSGSAIEVNGAALTIIGVAPETFAGTGLPPETPDLWIPASAQAAIMPGVDWLRDNTACEWQILARVRPGEKPAQYAAELDVIAGRWPLEDSRPVRITASGAKFFQMSGGAFDVFQAVCAAVMIAVSLVLMIGCVNLTNLVAVRNAGRRHEVALRLALGASRGQLIRSLCLETVLLGIAGGIAGFFLSEWASAWLGVRAAAFLHQVSNGALGLSLDLSPDWRIFLWAAAGALLAGVGVGILPAFRTSRTDVSAELKRGSAGASEGARSERSFLLAAQIAGGLILLSAAGLLFRGASRSTGVSAGFELQHLAVISMDTNGVAASANARFEMRRHTADRLSDLPQVESVAWADRAPFLGTGTGTFRNERGATSNFVFNGVSANYFATLGIPLLAGRTFTAGEIDSNAPVAVISSAAAMRLFPGEDPVGRTIIPAAGWLARAKRLAVVGVVKAVRSTYLSKSDEGYVYAPRGLREAAPLFLLRTRDAPEKAFPAFSAALAAVNANLPARSSFFSVEQGPVRLQELMAQAPAAATSALGIVALILAAIGIFGVVSRLTTQRTREIGIRIALGASGRDVVFGIGRQMLQPLARGTVVGLAGALAVSGLLRAMIVMPDLPDLTYGAGAFDLVVFLGSTTLLMAAVVAAMFLPMRRATRIEPAAALREE